MSPFFPMFVDISRGKTIVVGGGRVAERRVETLLPFGAQITVIAPQVTDRIHRLAEEGQLCWVPQGFEDTCLQAAAIGMIVAATNERSVNQRVGVLAREKGIPVSVADCKEESTFYFPGIAQKDHVVIGVTASGQNHKKAAQITKKAREMLEQLE